MSRQLYDELINYEGDNVFDDVLSHHIAETKNTILECGLLKTYNPDFTLHSQDGDENSTKDLLSYCLKSLFALSVCNDCLIVSLNNNQLSIQKYTTFFTDIGMTVSHTNAYFYHPFYHEIFQVVDDVKSEEERVTIHSELYPMIMFGDLQFSRAGVKVYAHPTIDRHLAEKSCLYFTNWRENRPCQDLSHGWGHNSRWGTDIVRNYDTDHHWKINVDGKIDLADKQTFNREIEEYDFSLDFTIEQAKELLFNRHLIHPASTPFTQLNNDIFPYDWRMDVLKSQCIKSSTKSTGYS